MYRVTNNKLDKEYLKLQNLYKFLRQKGGSIAGISVLWNRNYLLRFRFRF
jgi:hypothetical protein